MSGFPPPSESDAPVRRPGPPSARAQRFLEAALAQCRPASTATSGEEPIDCCELVAWAAGEVDLPVADEAHVLFLDMDTAGALIDVRRAIETPGALLFGFSERPVRGADPPATARVAISIGDGTVIEARGSSDTIGVFPASGRFEAAALIPGLAESPVAASEIPAPSASPPGRAALEPLPDHYGVAYALGPDEADAAGDGVTDRYDVVAHGARAMNAARQSPT